jgi:DUF177 domain-containing protein
MKKSYHAAFVFGQTGVAERSERMAIDGAHSMTSQAARAIDPARFARERSRVSGTLTLTQLPRVADLLFDREGRVSYVVQGGASAKGQPLLHISLAADLAVPCQRCLERLPIHLDVERDLVLVASVSDLDPLEDEDDDTDTIASAGHLDLHDLVEQEIVLSVPMAPRHPEDACGVQPGARKTDEAASPFSALAALKRQPK